MRKGFDSLSGLVQQHMQPNVLNGSIFIFINKKRNQVKLLLWEGDLACSFITSALNGALTRVCCLRSISIILGQS